MCLFLIDVHVLTVSSKLQIGPLMLILNSESRVDVFNLLQNGVFTLQNARSQSAVVNGITPKR